MKASLAKTFSSLVLALAVTSSALAVPISGAIGFTGPYSVDNSDLTLATSITFNNTPGFGITTDGSASGSFAGIASGTAVTMFTPLTINQGPGGTGVILPAGPIWSVGGFTLTLTSLIEQFNAANSLNLYGLGILSDGNPANNSAGEWVATFNRSGVNFTFSASSSTAVPDGGATAALLGMALLGMGVFARRFRNA